MERAEATADQRSSRRGFDVGFAVGFGGAAAAGFGALASAGHRVLRLPGGALVDGPYRALPDGEFDAAIVEGVRESYGALAGFCATLRSRLGEGAPVVVDAVHQQSMQCLRRTVEARPRIADPCGDSLDPERPLSRRRLVETFADAGFLVRDCYAVSGGEELVRDELLTGLMVQDVVAFALRDGSPPRRLWLTASAERATAGTVLIGAGSDSAQQLTRSCVETFLPDGWDVVACTGTNEALSFDSALPGSRGESIWLLRAGTTADPALFAGLCDELLVDRAAVPGSGEVAYHAGDVSGMMIRRTEFIVQGPLAARYCSPRVAYESFCLGLDASTGAPAVVTGAFCTPGLPAAETDAEEAAHLVAAWGRAGLSEQSVPAPAAGHEPPPWVGRQPRLTLCMMTKNEEATLPRCLRSVQGCVDEIIVVDTGSTDRTVQIAESFGAAVLHREWTDDFSAPRNVGLGAATGDWILILDADEFLADGEPARVRRLVTDAGTSGFQLVLENDYGDGQTMGVAIVRLFRNLPGLRYENRIHEQVLRSLQAAGHERGLKLHACDVVVIHDGYTDARMQDRGKNERNDRLFRLQLADHPEDAYSLYKYGDFLRRVPGRRPESRVWLERAWAALEARSPMPPIDVPYAAEVAALLALEMSCGGDYPAAETVIDAALQRFMSTPNLHYIAAAVAAHRRRPLEAIEHYRTCMRFADAVLVVPVQEGITSWVALTGMAQAYHSLGDELLARRLLHRARRIKPDYEVAALALSSQHLRDGNPRDALLVLTEFLAVKPNSAGACQRAAWLLAGSGFLPQARAMGLRAITLLEEAQLREDATRMRSFVADLGSAAQTSPQASLDTEAAVAAAT